VADIHTFRDRDSDTCFAQTGAKEEDLLICCLGIPGIESKEQRPSD
jgi:hypothetical protein